MKNASEQQVSILRPDQAAFVVDSDGRISLLLPRDPNAPVSPGHRLLLAIAIRMNDPEWVEELIMGVEAAKARRKLGFL